jgi:NDP-sugar pyrophosphorylase family protein
MGGLTENIPKPMLEVLGKPILEYQLDNLPEEVDEVVLIVNYLGGHIQKYFGGSYAGKKILYVEQKELNGTAGALWAAQSLLHDRFMVMNGDDIYAKEDIEECLKYEWAALGLPVDELGSAGTIVIDEKKNVVDIVEKEVHGGGAGYINANFFLLDPRIFTYSLVKRPKSEEYGLPQTIVQAARDIPIHMVEATRLIRITEPDDLERAEEMLRMAN